MRQVGLLAALFLVIAARPATAFDCEQSAGPVAGFERMTTSVPSAGLRRQGGDEVSINVWYPALADSHGTLDAIGAPGEPIFQLGCIHAGASPKGSLPRRVVLLSHGFGGVARQLSWMAIPLAQAGYVVIGVDHPGTNGAEPITDEGIYAPWTRTEDLLAALDTVASSPKLGPLVDREEVSVVGFSLGGWTAALLGGARPDFESLLAFCASKHRDEICLPQKEFDVDFTRQDQVLEAPRNLPLARGEEQSRRDLRIKRLVMLAPALGMALEEASLRDISVPTLVIAGSGDRVTPFATNAQRIADRVSGARLVEIPDAGHYEFLSRCSALGTRVAADYCTDSGPIPRADIHQLAVQETLRHLAKD